MTVVKQVVFLLLLVAVSTYADHHAGHEGHEHHGDHGDHADNKTHADHADKKEHADLRDCANLTKTLLTKDLHKAFGDWVLVHSVSDQKTGQDLLANVSSSHIELHLHPDNKTISFKEWNMYHDKSCVNYFMKTSLPEDRSDSDHHVLPIHGYFEEKEGVVTRHNVTAELHFYETCDKSLQVVYKAEGQQYLLNYRKEGHHRDAEELRAAHDRHDRQAQCLRFSHERAFRYDGAAEFCAKKTPDLPSH